jgi:hypothetical protein
MTKPQKPAELSDIELRPDGWDRFEKAIDAAVRTPAQRRLVSGRRPAALSPHLDASELIDALAALSAELPHCPPEIIERAINLGDLPSQLAGIEVDPTAAAAGKVAVCLKPSDRLRGLVAAVRARNFD